MTDAEVDGRRLRREQNREAVIDALVELFREGRFLSTTAQIAERAGLSSRSLFRYFDDVDDLNRTAIERMQGNARPLLELAVDADGPTAAKIDAIVDARLRLFERINPGARAARILSAKHRVVADQLTEGRSFLRHQVERLFAPELASSPTLLHAVDVLLSFETHELLRVDQGLSKAKTRTALADALATLLAPTKGTR